MGILLICEAPDCFNTAPAEAKQGRPAAPDGWWMMKGREDRFIVACCERHLLAIQKRDGRAAAA